MKTIKPMVYEALTPKQRVIATLEAEARDDQAEVRRLVDTCPKHTYRATDERYSYTMRTVTMLVIFLEMELRGIALAAAVASWQKHGTRAAFLRNMLTLHTAWAQAFAAKGLDFALAERMAAPIRDPFVAFFLDTAEKVRALDLDDMEGYEAATGEPPPLPCVEPDPAQVAQWQEMVEGYLEGVEG
ncbi:MAG: hypothetical protein JKP92_01475 [Alphaproteobacteria bacterium]|jgi:hypothetical protein|nr:hypothetical protein [Alphaproteobacteria bacterium]